MHPPDCREIMGKLPFWNRIVFCGLSLSWILSLLSDIPESLLASSVTNTFQSYKFWTIFTASLYIDNLLFLFIVIYNFNSFLPKLVPDSLFRSIECQLLSSC